MIRVYTLMALSLFFQPAIAQAQWGYASQPKPLVLTKTVQTTDGAFFVAFQEEKTTRDKTKHMTLIFQGVPIATHDVLTGIPPRMFAFFSPEKMWVEIVLETYEPHPDRFVSQNQKHLHVVKEPRPMRHHYFVMWDMDLLVSQPNDAIEVPAQMHGLLPVPHHPGFPVLNKKTMTMYCDVNHNGRQDLVLIELLNAPSLMMASQPSNTINRAAVRIQVAPDETNSLVQVHPKPGDDLIEIHAFLDFQVDSLEPSPQGCMLDLLLASITTGKHFWEDGKTEYVSYPFELVLADAD